VGDARTVLALTAQALGQAGVSRGRPARPIQGDGVLAIPGDRTGARGAALDAGGDQPTMHGLPADPIAPSQIPQTLPTSPVVLSELSVGRANTAAGNTWPAGDAPALEAEIHQAGATAQALGDLRRRVTPV
jgi:hypothetical protein